MNSVPAGSEPEGVADQGATHHSFEREVGRHGPFVEGEGFEYVGAKQLSQWNKGARSVGFEPPTF
jgi:hypothetical protein